MSTYTVQAGDTLSRIARRNGLTLNALLALNPEFKANPNDIDVGDVLRLARDAPGPRRKAPMKRPGPRAGRSQSSSADFRVPRGQLTFDAEGLENPGGPFHSRVLHVPSPGSGATIGRGYDMKERSRSGIREDLRSAGVRKTLARKLSGLSGLVGPAAEARIARDGLEGLEITPAQQKRLFLLVYDELAGDVKRICRKSDVIAKYGATDWKDLDPTIRDLLVDLRYRGDYTPATRERVQPPVVRNDLAAFAVVISDRTYWVVQRGVPSDRFRRRKEFVEA